MGYSLLASCFPVVDKHFGRILAMVAQLSITPECCLNSQPSNIRWTAFVGGDMQNMISSDLLHSCLSTSVLRVTSTNQNRRLAQRTAGIFGIWNIQIVATLVKELDALSNAVPFNHTSSDSKGLGQLIHLRRGKGKILSQLFKIAVSLLVMNLTIHVYWPPKKLLFVLFCFAF